MERGEGSEARLQEVEREVLKAADLLQVEGLLKHHDCLEAFLRGLSVHTAIEQLVWAHTHGPAEARIMTTEYLVCNGRRIRVRSFLLFAFNPRSKHDCLFCVCTT